MPVNSSAGLYSFSNQSRKLCSVCISTRWDAIGFVLIVCNSGVSRSHSWNHLQDGIGLFSSFRNHMAQLYIICFVAPLPPPVAWSAQY